ncbi:MAG TPA: hypothetical protein V6C98_00775 [Thermosynechococcaceae cyanobacterium]|jgi:hypothetical protein
MSPTKIESGKPKGKARLPLFYLTKKSPPVAMGTASPIASGRWTGVKILAG